MPSIRLPKQDGTHIDYPVGEVPPIELQRRDPSLLGRRTYAATHVVVDPFRTDSPWDGDPAIDWERTLRYRHHLWDLGIDVAEAMDTAQRGMGIGWSLARELIQRTGTEAQARGASFSAGVATDQLASGQAASLDEIVEAYLEQLHVVEAAGAVPIVMASRHLVAAAGDAGDYQRVYRRVLAEASSPVILHWLGESFDPNLRGYWGALDPWEAAEHVLALIHDNAGRIDGIKISLLDEAFESWFRAQLPAGVRLYTGDDFNYVNLIEGDGSHHSDALLGIFDPIAPAASAGLAALAQGDTTTFRAVLEPTLPLAREIFRAPTRYYKAGVVFLAWLNGHQDHFTMAGGMEAARGVCHYATVFQLADQAGLLSDPERARSRMRAFLTVRGIDG